MTLRAREVEAVLQFLLQFTQRCSAWFAEESLRAIGLVLHDSGDRCSSVSARRPLQLTLPLSRRHARCRCR